MKANELRIGNLVTVNNPKSWSKIKDIPLTVCGINYREDKLFPESRHTVSLNGISESVYMDISQFEQFIEPIPLNEEWLLRMGFQKTEEDEIVSFSFHDFLPYSVFYLDGCELRNADWINPLIIKYVHQLQNIYFAHKNEELIIK